MEIKMDETFSQSKGNILGNSIARRDDFCDAKQKPCISRGTNESEQQNRCKQKYRREKSSRIPFPSKLRKILEDAENERFEHIVGWLPDGLSFKVFQPQEFQKKIMPRYFQHTNYRSFQRLLSHYKFFSITETRAYSHPQFTKENKLQCPKLLTKNKNGWNKLRSLNINKINIPALLELMPTRLQNPNVVAEQDLLPDVKHHAYSKKPPVYATSSSHAFVVPNQSKANIEGRPVQIIPTDRSPLMEHSKHGYCHAMEPAGLMSKESCSNMNFKKQMCNEKFQHLQVAFISKGLAGGDRLDLDLMPAALPPRLMDMHGNQINRGLTVSRSREEEKLPADPLAFLFENALEPTSLEIHEDMESFPW